MAIGWIPPLLFVIAGVWAARTQPGWHRLDPFGRAVLALAGWRPGFLHRRGRVPHPSVVGQGRLRPGAQRLARGAQVAIPRRIIYQQVLGPVAHWASRCWSPSGASRTSINSSPRRWAAHSRPACPSSLLGVAGAIYQFIAGRDKKSTSSTFPTLRILHHVHAAGVRHPARGVFDRAGGRTASRAHVRCRSPAGGCHRARRSVRGLHRERQLTSASGACIATG